MAGSRCHECSQQFQSKQSCNQHKAAKHPLPPAQFECRVIGCDKWFRTLDGQEDHQRKKHRRQDYWLKPGPVVPIRVVVRPDPIPQPPSSSTDASLPARNNTQGDTAETRLISSTTAEPSTTSAVSIHCRICHKDPCNNLTATSCGHVFCNECITEEVSVSSACPICEATISSSNLFRIHLTV